MKVWLDDERPAPPGWTLARTYSDAADALVSGAVTEMSLDHDLADFDGLGGELTGHDVLILIEWLIVKGHIAHPPRLRIHTANPSARKKMVAAVASIERLAASPNPSPTTTQAAPLPPKDSR